MSVYTPAKLASKSLHAPVNSFETPSSKYKPSTEKPPTKTPLWGSYSAKPTPQTPETLSPPHRSFSSTSERESARQQSLDEVEAVLSTDYAKSRNLDNFNLLGVVTSPRMLDMNASRHNGSMRSITNSESHVSSSDLPRMISTAINEEGTDVTSSSSYMDPNFLSTMSTSISKEIESLNSTLYSYSRSYLGQYPEGPALDYQQELGYEDVPTRQLEELPKELLELDLRGVEGYLRKTGALTMRFVARDGESERVLLGDGEIDAGQSANKEDGEDSVERDQTSSVPDIFFNPYFDLTDPKTFESILVMDGDSHEEEEEDPRDPNGLAFHSMKSFDSNPIVRVEKPEKFTQHLDVIELALLNQVRSKSDSFFRETNRFSYLKSLVADSVDESQALQARLTVIRERAITDVEMVPILDKKRTDITVLGQVLDEIDDIIEVKGSIAGLIAAGDYLGAVEAIHMARQLLNGESVDKVGNKHGKRIVLGKLTALSKVNDQLVKYENLVVMDLSNELVNMFLDWESTSSGSSSASNFNSFLGSNSNGSSSFGMVERRSKVKHTMLALKKCKKLSSMGDIYRDKLCDTIRVTVRTTVNECASDAVKDISIATMKTNNESENGDDATTKPSLTHGATSMSFEQFMSCLNMCFEQILGVLQSAAGVNHFCLEEGFAFRDEDESSSGTKVDNENSTSPNALLAAANLSHKSISELLRLRKEAHSLVTFEEMKKLWDASLAFTLQVERFSGQKAYGLRSTLRAQATAFVERQHESNMSRLVAALNSEKWSQSDISSERQVALTRLSSGRAVISSSSSRALYSAGIEDTKTEATVEGKKYKVVWSCLLLVEMIMSNVACAAHFQTLAANVVGKTSELLRLFNSRATQLVLGAGAIHSVAQLKSINAKHLALVTQCVNMVLALLPHVRAALMAQLPGKQHTLLADLDKIKKEYIDHHDKVLSKFVSIIGGVVEHNLATRIPRTDFDERSKIPQTKDLKELSCCPFLAGVVTNTRKLHQVLVAFLPSEDLMDAFSRIFAHLDTKIPNLFITANGKERVLFSFPISVGGKRRMILEMKATSLALNDLPSVRPWDFTAMKFLERTLEVSLDEEVSNEITTLLAKETNEDAESGKNESNEIQENRNTHLDTGNSSEEPKEIYVDMVEQEERNGKNLNDMDNITTVKENPLTNEEPNGIQVQRSSASMDDPGNNDETQINVDGIKAIQFGSNEISSKVEGGTEAVEEVCSETNPNPLDEDAGIQAFVSGDLGKSDKEYDGPSETESDTLASSACASNEDQRDDDVGNLQ